MNEVASASQFLNQTLVTTSSREIAEAMFRKEAETYTVPMGIGAPIVYRLRFRGAAIETTPSHRYAFQTQCCPPPSYR